MHAKQRAGAPYRLPRNFLFPAGVVRLNLAPTVLFQLAGKAKEAMSGSGSRTPLRILLDSKAVAEWTASLDSFVVYCGVLLGAVAIHHFIAVKTLLVTVTPSKRRSPCARPRRVPRPPPRRANLPAL